MTTTTKLVCGILMVKLWRILIYISGNLFICLLIRSFVYSFARSFVRLLVRSFTRCSFARSLLVRLLVRSFVCSFVACFLLVRSFEKCVHVYKTTCSANWNIRERRFIKRSRCDLRYYHKVFSGLSIHHCAVHENDL